MKIRHYELEIPPEEPFRNCKLNREQYAKVLTGIVESYSDGLVLAINNEWGTGKSTFVKMWRQSLSNSEFRTIYFNAWENDFNSDPLVAIMSELQILVNSKTNGDKVFKSVLEKGAVLTKNVLPVLTKSLIKKYVVDIDDIGDIVENTTKTATEILEEGIKEYTKRKESVAEFRSKLEEFVKNSENSKPIIFIIDELDRCRPTYAVEVLEQLKHFFLVNGIVFILSIDKKHLASSVKGYYGSNEINTDEYLRRFINLEYSIPRPSYKEFCIYLFQYYNFDDFFNSRARKHILEFQGDGDHLVKMAVLLFDKTNATLRQQENVFGLTRLILNSFQPNQFTFPNLLFFLVYIKIMRHEFYNEIEQNKLTVQELSDRVVKFMPSDTQDKYSFNLLYVIALLLYFYNNSQNEEKRIKLLEIDTPHNKTTPIKIRLGKYESQELAKQFSRINMQSSFYDGSLDYLLSKINLNENLIVN